MSTSHRNTLTIQKIKLKEERYAAMKKVVDANHEQNGDLISVHDSASSNAWLGAGAAVATAAVFLSIAAAQSGRPIA